MFDTGAMVPIAFLLAVAFVLVGVTKIISDGRTRRRLIEAGVSAPGDGSVRMREAAPSNTIKRDLVKWARPARR